ncbi:hypothetical protein FA014_06365 [Cellulomonas hominis]|uniref:ESX secretion-associated protein EspG n=1 Tax=Cellulomonas hominis TaxID=156981 RepID=A0A7Z8NSH3_9CELL|nr:hypothetical protein [Cellulomonas hominis]TKR24399.1 hypothetical protein FA014_06365 [Cellulomonas hominis]
MTAVLAPVDGAFRARLGEQDWAAASEGVPGLPGWAGVLAVDRDGSAAAPPPAADAARSPADVDPVLRAAVEGGAAALVAVEVAVAAGERALLAVLWSDTDAGSGLARGVDVVPGGGLAGTTPRPGVEVSAFPTSQLVDEVLRHVPAAPVRVVAAPATVPEELTIALAQAIRTGDTTTVDALCAELGAGGPPAVVEAAVRGTDGSLVVSVASRGRTDVSTLSLLRTDAGWVELTRTADGQVVHTSRSREDVRAALLYDLTGRFTTATTEDDA